MERNIRAAKWTVAFAIVLVVVVLLIQRWSSQTQATPSVPSAEPRLVHDSNLTPITGEGAIGERETRIQAGLGDRKLELHVSSTEGGPVADALAEWNANDDDPLSLGATDDSGIVTCFLPTGKEGVIRISAVGFAPSFAPVMETTPQSLYVTLHQGSTIKGAVFGPTGSAAPGVWILARTQAHTPTFGQVASSMAGAHPTWDGGIARSDGKGQFTISSLRPTQSYYLVAGGQGMASYRESISIPQDREEISMRVLSAFSKKVLLRDDSGQVPRASPHVYTRDGEAWVMQAAAEAHSISVDSYQGLLLGLHNLTSEETSRFDTTFLYVSGSMQKELGPLKGAFAPAGYKVTPFSLWLPRLEDSQVSVETITVERTAQRCGQLEVYSDGAAGVLGLSESVRFPLDCILQHISGSPVYEFSTRTIIEPLVIDWLPVGEYLFYAQFGSHFASYPKSGAAPLKISIAENAPTVIIVPVHDLGGLTAEVLLGESMPYTGALTLTLQAVGRGIQARSHFLSPPYSIWGVEEGTYEVGVEGHGFAPQDQLKKIVEVRERQFALLTWNLDGR